MFVCRIFSGPVCSSVFVDNCKSCIFVVACQQVCMFVCKVQRRLDPL